MSQSLALSHDFAPAAPRPDAVGLNQVFAGLRRRWRWVAGPTLLALAGSTLFVNLVAPRYTGETKIILESRDSVYTRPTLERLPEQQPQIDEQAVASQVQVVMSRDLAREAIRRLGLVGRPEFDPLVDGISVARRVLILAGLQSNPLDRPPEDRVLDFYYERLLVYPVGKSRIIAIEFRSRDPELAARAANTIAELYLNFQEAAKKDTARSASTWLAASIDDLRARVAQAEAKVEEYRARTGLFLGANNAPVAGQQLGDLNAQLAAARSAGADAQAKAGLIRDMIRGGRTFEIPDVANNELIRRLSEQRITLRAQLALEAKTLLSNHPRIKELTAQLSDLDAQMRAAAERTVRTLENDARIAAARVETLSAALEAQKKTVAGANESEVQLRALEREARIQREQLEGYLQRYREATARDAENAVPADARVVSRAIEPQLPSFPKKLPIILFATLAALVLSAAGIAARELLADAPEGTPARGKDAEGVRGSGLVAPTLEDEVRSTVAALRAPAPAAEPVADAFDLAALIERLQRGGAGEHGRRVVVVGHDDPAAAAALARALGRKLAAGGRTLLVTLEGAGAAGEPGFSDLVAGEAAFAEVITREPGSRLHRVGPGAANKAILAAEPEGVEIALAAFAETYEWLICAVAEDAVAEEPGGGLLPLLAKRAGAVIIASEAAPTDAGLVALYDRAGEAGAGDVIVARQTAPDEVVEAA